MSGFQELRLRQPSSGSSGFVEWSTTPQALRYELLTGDRVDPTVEVLRNDRWVALADDAETNWLDDLADELTSAADRGDAPHADRLAHKLLRYCRDESREAVCAAHFVQGFHRFVAGEPRGAIDRFQRCVAATPHLATAAWNNLAAAWVQLLEPKAAWRALDEAIRLDPSAVVARVSLYRLARALAAEQAPTWPGIASWSEISREQLQAIHKSQSAIRSCLAPQFGFPSLKFWIVVGGDSRRFPRLAGSLHTPPYGAVAARKLLDRAEQALGDGDSALARALARSAAARHPTVKQAAEQVGAEAAARLSEAELLERAEARIAQLERFFRDLRQHSLEDVDAARESSAMLAPSPYDAELDAAFRKRIEELSLQSLDDVGPGERARGLSIAAQFADGEDAATYRRAATACLAGRAMRMFWSAVQAGDDAAAAEHLAQACRILGPESFERERKLLLDLRRQRRLRRRDSSPGD